MRLREAARVFLCTRSGELVLLDATATPCTLPDEPFSPLPEPGGCSLESFTVELSNFPIPGRVEIARLPFPVSGISLKTDLKLPTPHFGEEPRNPSLASAYLA